MLKNPSIDAACVGFENGRSYCVEAWGEPLPPSTTAVASSAELVFFVHSGCCLHICGCVFHQRLLFHGSSSYIYDYHASYPCYYSVGGDGIVTPTPIQPGLAPSCNKFHFVVPGDDCWNIAVKYFIAMTDVVDWNPSVNSDCAGLWGTVYMCVGLIEDVSTTSVESATTSLSPSTTTAAPGNITTPIPIQPGMVSNCDRFHLIVSGDDCWNIAAKYSIAMIDVVALNPGVKSDSSGLWLAVNVCISAIKDATTTSIKPTTSTKPPTSSIKLPTTTTPGNGVTTPTPIQLGIVSNCNKFHWITKGVVCSQITSHNRISRRLREIESLH